MFSEDIYEVSRRNPKSKWILVTLTVQDCPLMTLKYTLDGMNIGWQRLISKKELDDCILGFVRLTDVGVFGTKNIYAKPRFRALILVNSKYYSENYINRSQWIKLWKWANRTEDFTSVEIQAISNNTDVYSVLVDFNHSDRFSNYQDKGSETLERYSKQIYNLKFINFGGVLRNSFKELTAK